METTGPRSEPQRMTAVTSRKSQLAGVDISAEWRAHPCWEATADDPTPTDVPFSRIAEDYGVSGTLLRELDNWDEEFQQLLNPDDPASSEFPSEETKRRWVERGRNLARKLGTELGQHVRVTYFRDEVIQAGTEHCEKERT